MGDSEVMLAMRASSPVEREAYVNRAALRAMIIRHITCQLGGGVLDIGTAVLVDLRRDTAEGDSIVAMVMTGEQYDAVGKDRVAEVIAQMTERGVTVVPVITDGRDFTASGKLRAGALARLNGEHS
jgi:CBS domain-containing protein